MDIKNEVAVDHDKALSTSDLEKNHVGSSHLTNDLVKHVMWKNLNVTVKDRTTKQPLSILDNANGFVRAGEMLAIMGPSGSGKTTLLNTLAHRVAADGATTTGDVFVNGQKVSMQTLSDLSSYVEQEDALTGCLTVQETMKFAAGLALSKRVSREEKAQRVKDLIASFGLSEQSNTIVGTPLKKGLSGGQKKRLGVASRLITEPKILFLDEPTSGLDSTLSFEVMNFIRKLVKENNLIVIASIHQPSTATYKLFDKLCLLSKGKMCYYGPLSDATNHFHTGGYTMPTETNPAEFFLDLVNTDLAKDKDDPLYTRVNKITENWESSEQNRTLVGDIDTQLKTPGAEGSLVVGSEARPAPWFVPWVLLKRAFVKSYRDIIAYHIRIIMYMGLAIMMSTVWLRLKTTQESIIPFTNSFFFGGAFMSFMAVAYIPAYIEDLHTFKKERANGLAGPLAFTVSNFIMGLPYLFIISLLFSVVNYWLTNFRPSAHAFFMFVMWLFLDLVAAESLVVLISNIFPIFVVSLAITAFANGLWMCVDGFLVPMSLLNPFWKYVFHYIDYQAYVFQGLMVNEFKARVFDCDKTANGYQCMYPSSLQSEGKIDGRAVLENFRIAQDKEGMWVGIMIAIIAGYRILGYITLVLKR